MTLKLSHPVAPILGEVRMGFVYERSDELANKMIKVHMTTSNPSQNRKSTIRKAMIWGYLRICLLKTKSNDDKKLPDFHENKWNPKKVIIG